MQGIFLEDGRFHIFHTWRFQAFVCYTASSTLLWSWSLPSCAPSWPSPLLWGAFEQLLQPLQLLEWHWWWHPWVERRLSPGSSHQWVHTSRLLLQWSCLSLLDIRTVAECLWSCHRKCLLSLPASVSRTWVSSLKHSRIPLFHPSCCRFHRRISKEAPVFHCHHQGKDGWCASCRHLGPSTSGLCPPRSSLPDFHSSPGSSWSGPWICSSRGRVSCWWSRSALASPLHEAWLLQMLLSCLFHPSW